ncbi:MAG: hypothetical protein JWP91_1265 [Fibrobacteres bacterium]|nr:hypothetical protein [Fibrobacterota bacterium]
MAIAFLVCWSFTETSLGLILGAAGLFNPLFAALGHAALFGSGIAWLRSGGKRLKTGTASPQNAIGPSKAPMVIVFLFLAASMRLLWNGLTWPTVEMDSLGYHLPLMIKLIRTGTFSYLNHWEFQEHFPRNWETLGAVLCLAVHRDTVALFPNVIAWCLFGGSIACLSMKAGASPARALAAAFLMLSAPIFVLHMQTMHIDLPFAAYFLAAIYFTLSALESKSMADRICLAMASSMFLGIKSTGLPYAFWLALAAASCAILADPAGLKGLLKARSIPSLGWVALILGTGAFWYAYNLLRFGNPLVGIRISLGGQTVFPGEITMAGLSESTIAHAFDPFRPGDIGLLYGEILRRLSFPFLILLSLAAVHSVSSLAKIRELLRSPRLSIPMVLAFAAFLLYCKTPFSGSYNTGFKGVSSNTGYAFRLGFPFLGLLAVLGALGLERLKAKDPVILFLAVSAFALSLRGEWKIIAATLSFAAAFLASQDGFLERQASFLARNGRRMAWISGLAALTLFFAGYVAADSIRDGNRLKRSYGPAMDFIGKNLKRGEAIAFPVADHSYALFGSDFSHDVRYRPYRPMRDSGMEGIKGWVGALKAEGVSIIGIGPTSSCDSGAAMKTRLDQSPGTLRRIFGNDPGSEPVLYRILD